MMPEKPQKPVSLNDCFKSLETIRDFYQSHGGDESVFNSVKNLEKVSFRVNAVPVILFALEMANDYF